MNHINSSSGLWFKILIYTITYYFEIVVLYPHSDRNELFPRVFIVCIDKSKTLV